MKMIWKKIWMNRHKKDEKCSAIRLAKPLENVRRRKYISEHLIKLISFSGRLLLITDNRESVSGIGKKRCIKGVVEHLASMGVECESRPLSVGDYLWLLQWIDWEGQQQELVLDYIVERKTWDDLKVFTKFNK